MWCGGMLDNLTGSKYPFYVIKENMAIIPIHDESDLVGRLGREDIQYDSDTNRLYSTMSFSLYHPSGPSIYPTPSGTYSDAVGSGGLLTNTNPGADSFLTDHKFSSVATAKIKSGEIFFFAHKSYHDTNKRYRRVVGFVRYD